MIVLAVALPSGVVGTVPVFFRKGYVSDTASSFLTAMSDALEDVPRWEDCDDHGRDNCDKLLRHGTKDQCWASVWRTATGELAFVQVVLWPEEPEVGSLLKWLFTGQHTERPLTADSHTPSADAAMDFDGDGILELVGDEILLRATSIGAKVLQDSRVGYWLSWRE